MRALLLGLVVIAGPSCVKEKKHRVSGVIEVSPQANAFTGTGKLDAVEVSDTDIEITGTLKELKPGNYVVHVHKHLGCPPPQAGHDGANHHADLGVITADASGNATLKLKTPGRLGGGDPMTGFCLVIYPPDTSTYVASGKILTGGLGLAPH